MTGTIAMLHTGNAGGVIQAANGLRFDFELAAVLQYDTARLAVGRVVSFDLETNHPRAVNVCIQSAPHIPQAAEKKNKPDSLRYVGFEHRGSIRLYKFERVLADEQTGMFTVGTELSLFTKHGLRLQEGPALCLRVLAAALDASGAGVLERSYSLTEQDVVTLLAQKIEAPAKSRAGRRPATA